MLALLLVGALVAQSALGAPNRCTEPCDEPITSGAITGRTKNGYSSYSSYGSHSSWSSGSGTGASVGSRNGLGGTGGRIENLDENVIGAGSAIGGLERPGTWEDKKHYVTDDGRGEMSYRAGQTVTNNGFSKFAQHSYRYGTHDNHQPRPDSQILTTAEFEREFQSMRQRISNFMNSFRLDTGSIVNAKFLQDFTSKANLMTTQMNNVCNQVGVDSQMYQQMQAMIEQFHREVEQRQREIENVIYQSTSNSNVNVNANADWVTYQPTQPSPAPVVQYPTRPSVNMEVVVTQQIEQQLNVVHNLVANFASSFSQPEDTPQYQSNLNAEINVINQKISELSQQALQHESVRARFEQLKTYFESCVTSIRTRIDEIDRRNREIEERRRQREEELRREAERQAEEQRLEQLRIQEENRKAEEQRLEQLRIQEENRKAEEQRLEQIRIQEENDRIQREQQYLAHQQILLQQQQQQQQQQQLQLQQQQPQQQYQPTQYPQTSGSSVQVSGSIEHSYSGTYGAQVHATGGSTGSSAGYAQTRPTYPRPSQVTAPEVDIIAVTNRLQQDLNRLQNEVNRFNSFSMRLTSANSQSLSSEAESTVTSLQNRINNLCETSNKYQNTDIYNLAQELEQRLQGFFQSFKSQAASYSAQYNSQFSQNGQYASSGGYQTSAGYGAVHAPKVSNVEYEHSRSTDVEITGRNLNGGRHVLNSNQGVSGRYARSVGEDYGPYFDSDQGSLEYGQQQQPIFDNDYTYGRNGKVVSYDKPHGYVLQKSEIPDSFEDYSQRTGPIEMPREYQPVRSGYSRQGVARHQSQSLHQIHQTEDLTYQPGAVDDYYSRQYSQGQVTPLVDSQWERENDSTQQNVSYGESEDLENLERSRSQKIDSAHNSRDQTLVSDAGNREINRSNQQINRLDEHRARENENPNASGKARIAGSYSKFESAQRTEELTLEKSGFNDYFARTDNPASTNSRVRPITSGDWRLEEQTEEPQSVRPISAHEKFEYSQKTENLTLEQSGFYDFKGSTERPRAAENPRVATVSSSGKAGSALEIEDLNLENSGFNDYSSQNRDKKLNDKPQRIRPPQAENFEINQQNEKHDLQQSGFGSLYSQNEKMETFDQADLSQQTAGQINFGAESQVGRQFSSYSTPKPGKLDVDNQENLKPDIQNLELGRKSEHPVGQYIENLSQQREQSSLTVESSNLNYAGGQPKVDDQADKISTTTRYSHNLLSTVHPTVKPAPKPVPRYTRPWQVSQVNSVPKKLEIEEKQSKRDSTKIEESLNLQNIDKHSGSLRGDLPGVSETSTIPVPVATEKLGNNQQVNLEYDSREQFEQVNINVNKESDDLQKSRNDYVQNNNRDIQSGQTNYFTQQSIQHNYEHSQQSVYYSQQNNGRNLNPTNYPLYEPNSNDQQISLPRELERDQLGTSRQEDVRQQVQTPSFEEQPSQFEQDTQQREEEEFAERVIPLEETKNMNDLSETETTTAPPSFWKRVGHKLSNSYDKAKEKARNIFG